jgi:polyphosphate kinase
MPRNLNQRVEVLFPVQDQRMIRHIRDDLLDIYLQDNISAWRMQPDGDYEKMQEADDEDLIDVQAWFLNRNRPD